MLLYFKDKDDLHHMQVQKERKKKGMQLTNFKAGKKKGRDVVNKF